MVDVQIIYKKLYQRELVTSDWFFVIRNSSGVQIFRNDEKARQRHLPKMYTLVVTMNWNRFRKIFRIRFCIFYNRSELSHCMLKRYTFHHLALKSRTLTRNKGKHSCITYTAVELAQSIRSSISVGKVVSSNPSMLFWKSSVLEIPLNKDCLVGTALIVVAAVLFLVFHESLSWAIVASEHL